MLTSVNLVARFILEIALLAALVVGSLTLWSGVAGVVLAALVGVGAATLWGLFVSPKGAFLAREPIRWLIEAALFGAGAAALWLANRPIAGIALLAAGLMSGALTRRLGGNWSE